MSTVDCSITAMLGEPKRVQNADGKVQLRWTERRERGSALLACVALIHEAGDALVQCQVVSPPTRGLHACNALVSTTGSHSPSPVQVQESR